MNQQPSLLDLVTDKAIQAAGDHADPGWTANTLKVVRHLAQRGRSFTTDDVWAFLEVTGHAQVREPRAMGAVMRDARNRRIIRSTGTYRKSTRTECHGRPVMIWEPVAPEQTDA